jgi:hypothetical protein
MQVSNNIKCIQCDKRFSGWIDKEDTCPKCLKRECKECALCDSLYDMGHSCEKMTASAKAQN